MSPFPIKKDFFQINNEYLVKKIDKLRYLDVLRLFLNKEKMGNSCKKNCNKADRFSLLNKVTLLKFTVKNIPSNMTKVS